MKKLIILKSLVDFIWIVTCIPLVAILLFFAVYMFINPESLDVIFNENFPDSDKPIYIKQLFTSAYICLAIASIYCLFVFRKTLRYFQKAKPFHSDVIQNFYKIGYLLVGVGLLGSILTFISRIVLLGQFKISMGLTPHLILMCLGLFFMILSETFKVAKHAKEENELTI
ncbi:MAG: hypothetical protein Wins2KO_06190 [Winogradskyella sp.]